MASEWFDSKHMLFKINSIFESQTSEDCLELEHLLRKFRPDLINLLKYSPKSSISLETLKKAVSGGLVVEEGCAPISVSSKFVEETLILSELYGLNEIRAANLLLAGEQQLSSFPGVPRGLVAVLVFHDYGRCWAEVLRTLLAHRPGRMWSTNLNQEISDLVVQFTDQLWNDGIFTRLIELAQNFNLQQTLEKLLCQKGLGNPKHRKMVRELVTETYEAVAECIFLWSNQVGLKLSEFRRLTAYLKACDDITSKHGYVRDSDVDMELGDSGKPADRIVTTLLMAALVALNTDCQNVEEDLNKGNSEAGGSVPAMLQETEAIFVIQHDLVETNWALTELQALVVWRWALTVRLLAQTPSASYLLEGFTEDEDEMLEKALICNVFQFTADRIVGVKGFHRSEFFVRCLHGLVSETIVYFFTKIKELRSQSEEEARLLMECESRGESPPECYFLHQNLMLLVSKLYGKDELGLCLTYEYWISSEMMMGGSFSRHTRASHFQMELFKFVRSCMDARHASLYSSTLTMLRGLSSCSASAEQCFTVLKANAVHAGNQMSWDHVFGAFGQYLMTLRSSTRTVHFTNINPDEVDGLVVWLKLVESVAEHDSAARLAFCDHLAWACPATLFGLAACPIPAVLKSQIFLTLASLAKSPEVASLFWQALENSGILVKTEATAGIAGIEEELEEIETQQHEYPVTIGFLSLLKNLCSHPFDPSVLPMRSQFMPYLNYVNDRVFSKCYARSYKNTADMWQIVSLCSEILRLLMVSISSELLILENRLGLEDSPPGLTLLTMILSDSDVLRMILMIVDEGAKIIDQWVDFAGKSFLEAATLSSLRLLSDVFAREGLFLQRTKDMGARVLTTSLQILLQCTNPRTGEPDYMVNIAKYVTFSSALPKHAYVAVKLVHALSNSLTTHPKLTRCFVAKKELSQELLIGFVDCMDATDLDVNESTFNKSIDELTVSEVRGLTSFEVIDMCNDAMILGCSPNLALYLLGFDALRPQTTQLQDPSINNSLRSVLHSLLPILNNQIQSTTEACSPDAKYSFLLEPSYPLLHSVAANSKAGPILLRYLRTGHDFIFQHLAHWISACECDEDVTSDSHYQLAKSYLLKMVAIELRILVSQRQPSQINRLLHLLFSEDDETVVRQVSEFPNQNLGTLSLSMLNSHVKASRVEGPGTKKGLSGKRLRKISFLIDGIEFAQPAMDQPSLEFFDSSKLSRVIEACTTLDRRKGHQNCDLTQLHLLLHRELSSLAGTTLAGQQGLIHREIQTVLEYVLQYNQLQSQSYSQVCYLEGWRQLSEITFTIGPMESFSVEERSEIMTEVLDCILTKALHSDLIADAVSIIASVVHCLFGSLRKVLTEEIALMDAYDNDCSALDGAQDMSSTSVCVSLLDGTRVRGRGREMLRRTGLIGHLSTLLKRLLEFILRPGNRSSHCKTLLYGSLLNFCFLTKPTGNSAISLDSVLNEATSARELIAEEHVQVLSQFLPDILPILCSDACDGSDVCKTLAMSCLASLVSSGSTLESQLVTTINSRGWLVELIDSLRADDQRLQELLTKGDAPLKPLYIYRARMVILTAIANTEIGAASLMQHEVLGRLAECQCFQMMPSDCFSDHHQSNSLAQMVSFGERFNQVLTPALRLCVGLANGAGWTNRTVGIQILGFLAANLDTVSHILRSGAKLESLRHLELVSMVTELLPAIATESDIMEMGVVEFRSTGDHILRQALWLLPHFAQFQLRVVRPMIGGSTKKSLIPKFGEKPMMESTRLDASALSETGGKSSFRRLVEIEVISLQILSHLIDYCYRYMTQTGTSSKHCKLMFSPALKESNDYDFQDVASSSSTPPNASLATVANACYQLAEHADTLHRRQTSAKNKMASLADDPVGGGGTDLDWLRMNFKHSVVEDRTLDRMSYAEKQKLAVKSLRLERENADKQISLVLHSLEQGLFIMWRHVEMYLSQPASAAVDGSLDQSSSSPSVYQLLMRRAGQKYPSSTSPLADETGYSNRTPTKSFSSPGQTPKISAAQLREFRFDVGMQLNEEWFEKMRCAEGDLQANSSGCENMLSSYSSSVLRHLNRLVKLRTGQA